MGIPVITFNARGCNELVVDNYNGYLVNPSRNNMRNVKELFQQIITLFNNSELRSSFAKNAIMGRGKLARENFINENVDWYKTKFNLNDR
jgi:glycosyltransferase involved in cell wall biosynthesis